MVIFGIVGFCGFVDFSNLQYQILTYQFIAGGVTAVAQSAGYHGS